MSRYYVYRMDILENDTYYGVYFGQHKMGKKDPSCDGYEGSGSKWKKEILRNHVPVKKTILKVCETIEEANYWERYYIEQATHSGEYLWNITKGGDRHDYDKIYTEEEKRETNRQRCKKWYDANKERNVENNRKWRSNNRERVREARRRNVEKRKDYWVEYHKQYYQRNKERLSARNKQYYEEHREHITEHMKEYGKQYAKTHAEYIAERGRKYYAENKEKRKAYYERLCCYEGETMTLRALSLRFFHQKIPHSTLEAKKYLIDKGE